VLHAKLQVAPLHAGCALATVVVQMVPHALQLFGSLVRLTQLSLQLVVDGGQIDAHA
jgi:hypothetical protein